MELTITDLNDLTCHEDDNGNVVFWNEHHGTHAMYFPVDGEVRLYDDAVTKTVIDEHIVKVSSEKEAKQVYWDAI